MDDSNNESRPRRITRRSRNGFAFSNSSIGDSTSTEGGGLNDSVEQMAASAPEVLPRESVASGQVIAGSPNEEFNPRGRMEQVRRRASVYEKEYRLNLLHRLLMRRVPMDEIAEQLGISVSQVYRDRDELKERLRDEARKLDIDELIGDSKGFYEEAAAIAMRAASQSSTPMAVRLAAVRTGLAAKNDLHRFMQTAGVYDVLRYRLAQNGTAISDVRRLMENTERILAGDGFSNKADSGDDEEIEL